MQHARIGFAVGLTAILATTDARAGGDFVFGDDFEGVPACGTGFAILATPAARSTTLGTQMRYFIKTRACGNGGTVNLGETGAPASWATSIDPATQTIGSGATGVALMTVNVPTNGDAGLGTFDITAQNGVDVTHAGATLDVANEVLIHFAPDGTGSGLHAFPASLTLKVGAKIRLIDDDTTAVHRIHGDGVIPHQAFDMTAGQEYDVTPVLGVGDFYCHDHFMAAGETQVTVGQ